MKKNVYKISIVAIIACLSLTLFGISYAYFGGGTTDDSQQSIEVSTAKIEVTYTDCANGKKSDCANITANLAPGESVTKTFRLENTGTYQAEYNVVIASSTNTFLGEELVYSLTTYSGSTLVGETPLPYGSRTNIPLYSGELNVGASQEFKLTFTFKNPESGNNESNLNGQFTARLGVTN